MVGTNGIGGADSAVAAVLTAERGAVLVNGLHRDYRRRWTLDMDAMINPHVVHLCPPLLWRVQGEWDVLGFEAVDGRPADYRPGSADLVHVAQTIAALGQTPVPIYRSKSRRNSSLGPTYCQCPGWY